jgi:prepilin-type N-terminal cleavage/methylation domain-containing protein/prepilin-type processing-associated H-X9-DG protein
MEKRKGFTLIELLVVISIIALLLAILMPSLQRVRNNARAVVCQSNLKQWGIMLSTYTETDFNFHFASMAVFYNDPNGIISSGFKNKKFSICPITSRKSERIFMGDLIRGLEKSGYIIPGSGHFNGTLGTAFESWTVPADSNGLTTYSGSYGFSYALCDYVWRTSWNSLRKIEDIRNMKKPYNIPFLLDSASPWSIFLWEGQTPPPTEEESTSCCINRHDGSVNSLFLDWSVRKVGLKELWKLKWHKEFNTNGSWTAAGGVKPEDWPEWMREFKDY